ncbi:MAG: NAD(P)H-dependent oxidoreductase [Pseudomonadota bacterium]
MHVLTVVSHPNQKSFSHALAHSFRKGAEETGNTVEIADLHAEEFDPIWSMSDVEHAEGAAVPDDIRKEQVRIERCDAVCLVFPLYWFGMPAMMKGWIDRVWSWGWAYDQLEDHNKSLQKPRTIVLLVPAGANPNEWEPYASIEQSMKNIWCIGTLGYFGFNDKRVHMLNGATGSLTRRKALLKTAYQAGMDMKKA